MQLGSALTEARRERKSGWIEIQDRGSIHGIQLNAGAIANVVTDASFRGDVSMHDQAIRLFSLTRPRVNWISDATATASPALVDPSRIILSGMVQRQDLFDPRVLVQRIPVQTLHIPPALMNRLRSLPLSRRELDFLYSLRIPTPIPMILWKRGLDPSYAGALLVALNIMGLWKGHWEPGVLPRITAAVQILKKAASRASDYDILGLHGDSTDQEQDRAFRKLSLALHPDRVANLPEREQVMASKAFETVNTAYQRVRTSRRRRPVRSVGSMEIAKIKLKKQTPDSWSEMLDLARQALAQADYKQARAYALKGLSLSPPPAAKRELTSLFAQVA